MAVIKQYLRFQNGLMVGHKAAQEIEDYINVPNLLCFQSKLKHIQI